MNRHSFEVLAQVLESLAPVIASQTDNQGERDLINEALLAGAVQLRRRHRMRKSRHMRRERMTESV